VSSGGVEVAFSTGDNDGDAGGRWRCLAGEGIKSSFGSTTYQVLGRHAEFVPLPTVADLTKRSRQYVGDDGLFGRTDVKARDHQLDSLGVATGQGTVDERLHQVRRDVGGYFSTTWE
jgi:hypothetical protein